MVWALAVTETVGYGVLFYSFAVFVVPMRAALHTSTGALDGAFSLSIAVNGVAAVFAGRWVDRHGTRALMTTGSVVAAVSVVGWSQAHSLIELYAAFVGLGISGAGVLYEPAFALINTWFDRDRHAALLTLTVVAGLASTVFLPTAQALVGALGWRSALVVLAGLLGVCAVPHAALLRRHPDDVGMPVDGRPVDEPASVETGAAPTPFDTSAYDVGAAWRRPAVRWLTAAAVLETLAVTVVAVHVVAYLRDTGERASVAAATAGAIGILSVTGRIVLTSFANRVGLARLTAVMVAGQAAGIAALFWLSRPASLVVFVVLFGAGFGVMTIARAALLGRYVPVPVFASVSGGQALAANAGRVAAPVVAGAVIGAAGYGVTFAAVSVAALLGSATLLAAEHVHRTDEARLIPPPCSRTPPATATPSGRRRSTT